MPEPEFYTLAEVAALFRVTSRTIWIWRSKGKLTGIRTPGGRYIYRRTDVNALLEVRND